MATNQVSAQRELRVVEDPKITTTYTTRVAFATRDRIHVDQHFGSARIFLVYGFHNNAWHLIKAIEYPEQTQMHDVDKLAHRVKALADCDHVYCNEIGPSAIRRLIKNKIQPLKVSTNTCIASLLKSQRHAAAEHKTDKKDSESRLLNLLDEEWD